MKQNVFCLLLLLTLSIKLTAQSRATVWDDHRGTVSVDVRISVQHHPSFVATQQTPICSGMQTMLTSTPTASYWTFLDGTRLVSPLVSPTATERYIAVLTGICMVFNAVEIHVDDTPVFKARPDTTILQGTQVVLWATPGVDKWLELPSNAELSESTYTELPIEAESGETTVAPETSTTYVAKLQTPHCGTLSDTVHVCVIKKGEFDIEMNYGAGCYNGDGWILADVVGSSAPFSFGNQGNVVVAYTLGICTDTTHVRIRSNPEINVVTKICEGLFSFASSTPAGGKWFVVSAGVATVDTLSGRIEAIAQGEFATNAGSQNLLYQWQDSTIGGTWQKE